MFPIRTVRQENKFDEQVTNLGITCERIDDVLSGVFFALARQPEAFSRVPGTELWIIKTSVHPGAPSLRIVYTFNEMEVHLLMVEFCEDDVIPSIMFQE